MSDCNVCLYGEGGYSEFSHSRNVKAAKEHKCCECFRPILKGEVHQVISGKFEGDFYSERTCLVCAEIRHAFYCENETIGEFWNQMEDLFRDITVSGDCLKKLKTPEAKRYFAERYRQWNEARA